MWKSGPAETEIFRHCRHIFHLRFKACVRLACMAKQWHTLESQSGERKCFFRKGGEMMSFVVSTDGCKTFLWAIVSNCIYFNDLFIIFCQWIDEHLLLERVLWMVCKPCKYCIWAWDSSTADFTVKASEEQIMYRVGNRVGNNPCLHSFALFNDERGKEKFVGVRVCVCVYILDAAFIMIFLHPTCCTVIFPKLSYWQIKSEPERDVDLCLGLFTHDAFMHYLLKGTLCNFWPSSS